MVVVAGMGVGRMEEGRLTVRLSDPENTHKPGVRASPVPLSLSAAQEGEEAENQDGVRGRLVRFQVLHHKPLSIPSCPTTSRPRPIRRPWGWLRLRARARARLLPFFFMPLLFFTMQ